MESQKECSPLLWKKEVDVRKPRRLGSLDPDLVRECPVSLV